MLGKLGGVLRANKIVSVATHRIAVRHETNLRLPFRKCRVRNMHAPHYKCPMFLSLFWLADNKISMIGWQLPRLRYVGASDDRGCGPRGSHHLGENHHYREIRHQMC